MIKLIFFKKGVPLSRNVSSKIALKMLFTGEAITANEALTHGMISEVVVENTQDALVNRVNQLCQLIQANSQPVIELGKKCFYKQIEYNNDLEKAYDFASKAMVENLQLAETQMGMKAFKSKTKPEWTHSIHKYIK